MTITNRVSLKSVMAGVTPIADVPDAPTIGAATNVGTSRAFNNGSATVAYTAAPTGGTPATFTATSTPGSFTGTGTSPITVAGLQSATSYTFTVSAANANGTLTSAASSSITATTVPQAPTIGTATATTPTAATVAYTTGATGGSAITTFTATSSPGSLTGTGASPITVSGLTTGTAYTFTVTATNSNGTSTASAASNSITPVAPSLGAWSVSTNIPSSAQNVSDQQGNGNGSLIWVGGGISNGESVTNVGYKWNGSSWSSSNTELPIFQQIVQRLTASGSNNSLMRIVGYTSGFNTTSTTAIYNGTSWSNSATFPRQTLGVGFASLDGTGNVRTVGGDSLGGRYTYYQTSFGGSWIQNVIDSPILNSQLATGVDNNFGGKGWFWRQNSADAYECTSTTSAWTTLTSAPWGSIGQDFYVNATVVNGTVMVAPQFNNSPQGGTIYTFNGTTYTAQTSMSGNVANWNRTTIGAVSNVVSYIRNDSSPNANQAYHWRATFA